MKAHLLLAVALLASACDDGQRDWERAPHTYSCTVEQERRVEAETTWCADHGGYIRSFCYGSAIMRLCTPLLVKGVPT